jgi:DNA-binding GntR family transcriptional regulator
MIMADKPILNLKSLKDQVYEYLREQMHRGEILPGSAINMEETAKKLGVSKTPLRDALLQLEMEDFISILPRRGVVVNILTLQDIKNYYEIIGSLESTALLLAAEKIKNSDIKTMEKLMEAMKKAIDENDFDLYYERNLKFHNVFLNLCGNEKLIKIVNNLKKRLYDFPRQEGFVKEWEETSNSKEHHEIFNLIKEGKYQEAASYIRDVHWSFQVQEKFVNKYYAKALQYTSTLTKEA